jgi:PEGA domain-containing protein
MHKFSGNSLQGRRLLFVTAFVLFLLTSSLAQNRLQSTLRFDAKGDDAKNAGVWIDGQYVGYVKELTGDRTVILLPGKHRVVVRQAWYQDFTNEVVLEPGEVHKVKVVLARDGRMPAPEAKGELKISAVPTRAAVFVDEQFAGHVNEFDGVGKAMLLAPGKHRVRIALPGYLPFETVVDLHPKQKMKIQTELVKGSITEAGELVNTSSNQK